MISSYPDELWKQVDLKRETSNVLYAVSNHGRLASFIEAIEEGNLIKGSSLDGYPGLRIRYYGKSKSFYVHRLVADFFLEKEEDAEMVIHLDYDKKNNHHENLRWVSKPDWLKHYQKSPRVIAAREKMKDRKPLVGAKLNATDVMRIKKMINDPNRKTRMKMIAKQFNISEMQLYRIKSGENWGHIKVD